MAGSTGRRIKPGNRMNSLGRPQPGVAQPVTTGQQAADALANGSDYMTARRAQPIGGLGTSQPPNAPQGGGGPAPASGGDDKQTPRDRAGERGDDRFDPGAKGGNPRDVSSPNRGAPQPANPVGGLHPDMQNLVNALHTANGSPNVSADWKKAIGAHLATLPPGAGPTQAVGGGPSPQDTYMHHPRPPSASSPPAGGAPITTIGPGGSMAVTKPGGGDFIPNPGAPQPTGLDMASAANFNQDQGGAPSRVTSAPIPTPTPPTPPVQQGGAPGRVTSAPIPTPQTPAPATPPGAQAPPRPMPQTPAPTPTPDQPPMPTTPLGRAQQFANTLGGPARPGPQQ